MLTVAVTDGTNAARTGQANEILMGEVFQPDTFTACIGRILRNSYKNPFGKNLIPPPTICRLLEKGTGKNCNICIFTLGILNQPEIQSTMGFLIGNQGMCDQCRGSQYIHSNGTFPDVCHFLQYFRQLMQIFQNRL